MKKLHFLCSWGQLLLFRTLSASRNFYNEDINSFFHCLQNSQFLGEDLNLKYTIIFTFCVSRCEKALRSTIGTYHWCFHLASQYFFHLLGCNLLGHGTKIFASKILLLNGKVSRGSFETGRGNENYLFEHGVEKQLQHKF